MRFTFDLPAGAIARALLESRTAAARSVTRATTKAADRLKQALRQQVRAAGLGAGLEKAWQDETWPKGGKASLHPAALVYSKATALHAAFGQGAVIRARNARWLAIPLPEAVARGLDRAFVDRKGGSLSGAAQARRFAQVRPAARQLGALRFVPLDDGRALLVTDTPRTARHRVKHAARDRNGLAPQGERGVALFLLVRQVRVKKLLDFEGAAKAAGAEFNSLLRAAIDG
ncbi:MAG TPA: DUF6441 family protein [Vineibacter sp.]|nr:DUF6441 family protein [Vineibacter sp.]